MNHEPHTSETAPARAAAPDASGVAAAGAVVAGLPAFVLLGHLWPAIIAAACGAAVGAAVFVIARGLWRLLAALGRYAAQPRV